MIGIEIRLRDNLNVLLNHFDISDAELSKKTEIPQQTIHRLKSGATPDPRISTLKILANFFGITIGQLVGDEPVALDSSKEGSSPSLFKIPLLSPALAYAWPTLCTQLTESTHPHWVYTDQVSTKNAFALNIETDDYDSPFTHGSTVFVDCALPMTTGHVGVIANPVSKRIALKKIIHDISGTILLHPTANAFSTVFDDRHHTYLGMITGAKVSLLSPSTHRL